MDARLALGRHRVTSEMGWMGGAGDGQAVLGWSVVAGVSVVCITPPHISHQSQALSVDVQSTLSASPFR